MGIRTEGTNQNRTTEDREVVRALRSAMDALRDALDMFEQYHDLPPRFQTGNLSSATMSHLYPLDGPRYFGQSQPRASSREAEGFSTFTQVFDQAGADPTPSNISWEPFGQAMQRQQQRQNDSGNPALGLYGGAPLRRSIGYGRGSRPGRRLASTQTSTSAQTSTPTQTSTSGQPSTPAQQASSERSAAAAQQSSPDQQATSVEPSTPAQHSSPTHSLTPVNQPSQVPASAQPPAPVQQPDQVRQLSPAQPSPRPALVSVVDGELVESTYSENSRGHIIEERRSYVSPSAPHASPAQAQTSAVNTTAPTGIWRPLASATRVLGAIWRSSSTVANTDTSTTGRFRPNPSTTGPRSGVHYRALVIQGLMPDLSPAAAQQIRDSTHDAFRYDVFITEPDGIETRAPTRSVGIVAGEFTVPVRSDADFLIPRSAVDAWMETMDPNSSVRERPASREVVQTISRRQATRDGWCVICQDDGEIFMSQLRCGHIFCDYCIREWLSARDTCPTCRKKAA